MKLYFADRVDTAIFEEIREMALLGAKIGRMTAGKEGAVIGMIASLKTAKAAIKSWSREQCLCTAP